MFVLSCKNILILVVYVYVIFQMLKPNDIQNKVIVSIIAYFLLVQNEGLFAGQTELDTALKSGNGKQLNGAVNNFIDSSNIGNPNVARSDVDLNGGGLMGPKTVLPSNNMSAYDGLCLVTGNNEYWMKSPDNTPLLDNDSLYTYLGAEGPLKVRLSDQTPLIGPPVDGVVGSPEKMFMLANNVASPACCPSTFSTSTGCVCTTENQRDYIASRGTFAQGGEPDI